MGKKSFKKIRRVRFSSLKRTIEQGRQFILSFAKVIKKRKKQQQKRRVWQQKRNMLRLRDKTMKNVGKEKKKIQKCNIEPLNNQQINMKKIKPDSQIREEELWNITIKKQPQNSQINQKQIYDRFSRHKGNIGKLNFSIIWWDPNDLDIHVQCPCGTQINCFNKKCNTCEGLLDIDMNYHSSIMSLQPISHIFFRNPIKGLYKFWVEYFIGQKKFNGIKGESKYTLVLHTDSHKILQFNGKVSKQQKQSIKYEFSL